MPKIIVLTPFKFAHEGIRVEEFDVSDEPCETTAECAEVAVEEGWAELVAEDPRPPRGKKAKPAAPENKGDGEQQA